MSCRVVSCHVKCYHICDVRLAAMCRSHTHTHTYIQSITLHKRSSVAQLKQLIHERINVAMDEFVLYSPSMYMRMGMNTQQQHARTD